MAGTWRKKINLSYAQEIKMLKPKTIRQWKFLPRGVIGGLPLGTLQSQLDKTCTDFMLRVNPALVQGNGNLS